MLAILTEPGKHSRKTKVFALSLGQGTASVLHLATVMIMARVLTEDDLAAYYQTLLVFFFATPILQLGISQGIYYFLPKETIRIRGRVLDSLVMLGVMGALFGLFIGFGGNRYLAGEFSNPKVAGLLLWMIPFALVNLPASQVAPVLVVQERVFLSSFIGLARQFAIGIFTVAPLLIWANPTAPLIGHVIATVVTGLIAIALMLAATPKDSSRPSAAGIKELVWFSFPLGLASMVGAISMKLGNLIVSVNASPEIFAIFAMGARELPFIAIVTGAITSVLLPEMVRAFSGKEYTKALDLWKLAAVKASLFLFPLTVFLMFFAEEFVVVIFSSKYVGSTGVFMVFLGMLPLRVFSFGSILVSAGAARFILWRTLVWAVASLLLSLYLMKAFGMMGVAWGLLLSQYLLAMPLNYWKIRQVTKSRYSQLFPLRQLGGIMVMAFLPLAAAVPASRLAGAPYSLFLGAAVYAVLLAILYQWTGQLSVEKVWRAVRQSQIFKK